MQPSLFLRWEGGYFSISSYHWSSCISPNRFDIEIKAFNVCQRLIDNMNNWFALKMLLFRLMSGTTVHAGIKRLLKTTNGISIVSIIKIINDFR